MLRAHLVTSRDASGKDVSLAPGEHRELCRLEGKGRIVRLWVTLPVLGQRRALKDLVLRAFWDGERDASIEVPLGDFLGASFGRPTLHAQYRQQRSKPGEPVTLQFRLDHGLENSMAGEYTSVAYWYQAEPHAPFPALPAAALRVPSAPLKQLAQWGLVAGVVVALLVAVALAVSS